MSESDSAAVIEAFLDDLSGRQRVTAELIANYRVLIQDFLRLQAGRHLDALDAHDIEHYITTRVALDDDPDQTTEARTAARAFVQFLRGGGLERVRSAPPAPADAPVYDAAALAVMAEDLRRVWSLDGATFALAASAPLMLALFGKTMALLGGLICLAALAGTYFLVLGHLATGQPGLPKGASDHLGQSLWRGFMITLVASLPALVINLQLEGAGVDGLALGLATYLGALLGAALLPAAALAVYASRSGLAALAPHLWYRIVRRIPRPYARVATLYAASVTALWLWGVLVGLAFGPLPILASLVFAPVACMIVLVMAAGLGGVVHRNRFALGL